MAAWQNKAGENLPDKQAARLQNLEYYPIIHPDEIRVWSPHNNHYS